MTTDRTGEPSPTEWLTEQNEKLTDALIAHVGSQKARDLLKQYGPIESPTLQYQDDDPTVHQRAEMRCKTCGATRWVDFNLRHAGGKNPPAGVQGTPQARCITCVTGEDWTEWTGAQKWVD